MIFKFFLSFFAAIAVFFSGKPVSHTQQGLYPTATASATVMSTIVPTTSVSKPATRVFTPTPTAVPKSITLPTQEVVRATATPTPAVINNSFTPIVKSGTFRPGAGNCVANPSGSYTFEIVNYSEKDNITGVKFKGQAKNLTPNTRYIVNVGSKTSLGGPSVTTDAAGSLEFNFDNIAYSVNYKEIYSVSIDHPDKIYPDNSCLLDDLKEGVGYDSTVQVTFS